jgi:chloramphenicol-sensitive protein RarD
MQLAIGVFVRHEPMPPARLAGFVIVWVALAVFTADSLRTVRAGSRRPLAETLPEPV